ncbi:MAG: Trm112 family protein [Holosporales bacterium]|nr:Trm112 family protein [Holosporales bacterium]
MEQNDFSKKDKELDPRLLDIMVCPVTKASLDYDKTSNELISRKAKLAYPIKNGVPIMLVSEARKLED